MTTKNAELERRLQKRNEVWRKQFIDKDIYKNNKHIAKTAEKSVFQQYSIIWNDFRQKFIKDTKLKNSIKK